LAIPTKQLHANNLGRKQIFATLWNSSCPLKSGRQPGPALHQCHK
jgi:hypothetical protein